MSWFTLRLNHNSSACTITRGISVLDVILKKQDGWSTHQMTSIHQKITELHNVQVQVTGYLERMRPKSKTDSAPLCLHPHQIHIGTTTVVVQPSPTNSQTDEYYHLTPSSIPPTPSITRTRTRTRNRSGVNDKTRFAKFVDFLLDQFGGYDRLSQLPVLDIAGGAGALAFELSVRHSIPTLVVDSRPVKLQPTQTRHLIFRQQCLDRLACAYHTTTTTTTTTTEENPSPLAGNLKRRFQFQEIQQLTTLLDSQWVLQEEQQQKQQQLESTHPLWLLTPVQEKLRKILRNKQCTLLLGLHPDQATDPIVDIGLALGIPWAVIPCCVFPKLFPQRLLANGQSVTNYEDLCQYLREKDANVQELELPFQGRNRVFYWHPPESMPG